MISLGSIWAMGGRVGIALARPPRDIAPVVSAVTPWRLPAPVYRTVAAATGGEVFVLGGHDRGGATISSVYGFDPTKGASFVAGSLALATHGSAAAQVDGKILIFGGASAYVHDAVQEFDPATRKATVIGHMPGVRADTTAAAVGNQLVLVGGFNGYGPQADVWATTNGRSFRVLAALPQPVRYPAVGALGRDVYVFGGLISGGEYDGEFTSDIQEIDTVSGAARVVGHLPMPLAHAMAAQLGGHLYVIGGSAPRGPSAQVLELRPSQGTAVGAGLLSQAITDAAVATVGQKAYLLGGISANGPTANITTISLEFPSG